MIETEQEQSELFPGLDEMVTHLLAGLEVNANWWARRFVKNYLELAYMKGHLAGYREAVTHTQVEEEPLPTASTAKNGWFPVDPGLEEYWIEGAYAGSVQIADLDQWYAYKGVGLIAISHNKSAAKTVVEGACQ